MSEGGVDWAGLRVRDGVGMGPGPVGDMLRAPDSGSGDEAYWRIEGTAFYSHELFEATEPLTQILVDAVCDGDGTPLGLMFATDMLVEITCGYTSPHEEEVGSAGLADRCRAIVRHACPACTGWWWPWAAVRDTPGSPGEGEPVVIRGAEPDDREDEDLPRRRQPECRADPPL